MAAAIDLKDACVRAAREVIAERGIESLSLRDVARKLGVSHQAPYKHYPSRDHLLAEVMGRCFAEFARELDARERSDHPAQDLEALGRSYLQYAAEHPLEYRLMFGTPWPTPAEHPALVRDAVHAFGVLRGVLGRVYGGQAPVSKVDADALFIWSCMHGLASITQANVMQRLELDPAVAEHSADHVLSMISKAITPSN